MYQVIFGGLPIACQLRSKKILIPWAKCYTNITRLMCLGPNIDCSQHRYRPYRQIFLWKFFIVNAGIVRVCTQMPKRSAQGRWEVCLTRLAIWVTQPKLISKSINLRMRQLSRDKADITRDAGTDELIPEKTGTVGNPRGVERCLQQGGCSGVSSIVNRKVLGPRTTPMLGYVIAMRARTWDRLKHHHESAI